MNDRPARRPNRESVFVKLIAARRVPRPKVFEVHINQRSKQRRGQKSCAAMGGSNAAE
jgi:hypothetical protein